jgi:hypothetical protein
MSNTFISNSNYDVQANLLLLAQNYFGADAASALKVGVFGFMVEGMAQIARDGMFHRDFLYNELFLNTARLPESIYNWAKLFGFDVAAATPATAQVALGIKKSDAIAASSPPAGSPLESGALQLTIEVGDSFYAGSFEYHLKMPVVVMFQPVGGDYAFSAQQLLGGPFGASATDSPYVKTWEENIGGVTYIFLLLQVYQMGQTNYTFQTYSKDQSEPVIFTSSYQDQLSSIFVYYLSPEVQGTPENVAYVAEWMAENGSMNPLINPADADAQITIPLPAYFNDTTTPSDMYYCFYSFPSDGTVNIFFSTSPTDFRPSFGSRVKLSVWTTKGSAGNFAFSGQTTAQFSNSSLNSATTFVNMLTDSSGGMDKPTLLEVKQGVINKLLERNALCTETDLNLFFNDLSVSTAVNGSSVQFIKKQDDVLRRIFSAFVLLRDSNGWPVPTNTISFDYPIGQLEADGYVILPGTVIVYDASLRTYRILSEGEYPEDLVASSAAIVYTVPYLMEISYSPYPALYYFDNSADIDSQLTYFYLNQQVSDKFSVSDVTIQRNSLLDSSYTVSLSLTTTIPLADVPGSIVVRGILRPSGGAAVGWFNFDLVDSSNLVFSKRISTDDTFNSNNDFKLQGITSLYNPAYTGDVWVGEDLVLEVGVFYASPTASVVPSDNLFGLMADLPALGIYLVAAMRTAAEITFCSSLGDFMSSTFSVNQAGIFRIRSVPVVRTDYFSSYDNYQDFYSAMRSYAQLIMSNFQMLENNTQVDLKLYNTYGISVLHGIDTTGLSLSLSIALAGSVSYSVALDVAIKTAIMNYVESCSSSADDTISVSNLMVSLMAQFSEIKFIEFGSVNGSTQQKIQSLYPDLTSMTAEQTINYVPEYLNVSLAAANYQETGSFNPNIVITYE